MSKDRILSHQFSQKLSIKELESVSAAGLTSFLTGTPSTHNGQVNNDGLDVTFDH